MEWGRQPLTAVHREKKKIAQMWQRLLCMWLVIHPFHEAPVIRTCWSQGFLPGRWAEPHGRLGQPSKAFIKTLQQLQQSTCCPTLNMPIKGGPVSMCSQLNGYRIGSLLRNGRVKEGKQRNSCGQSHSLAASCCLIVLPLKTWKTYQLKIKILTNMEAFTSRPCVGAVLISALFQFLYMCCQGKRSSVFSGKDD